MWPVCNANPSWQSRQTTQSQGQGILENQQWVQFPRLRLAQLNAVKPARMVLKNSPSASCHSSSRKLQISVNGSQIEPPRVAGLQRPCSAALTANRATATHILSCARTVVGSIPTPMILPLDASSASPVQYLFLQSRELLSAMFAAEASRESGLRSKDPQQPSQSMVKMWPRSPSIQRASEFSVYSTTATNALLACAMWYCAPIGPREYYHSTSSNWRPSRRPQGNRLMTVGGRGTLSRAVAPG